MYTKEVTVNNEVGLHARPATYFIQKANEFKSGIWVEKEERRVNAKSLLGVLSLGIVKGTTITLIADGSDENAAVDALSELIEQAGRVTSDDKNTPDRWSGVFFCGGTEAFCMLLRRGRKPGTAACGHAALRKVIPYRFVGRGDLTPPHDRRGGYVIPL